MVTLDASGPLIDSGVINASGAKTGGTVTLAGKSIKLAKAQIAATGGTGGGSIALGGSATSTVSVDTASRLDASAKTNGNGGTIYVYGQTRHLRRNRAGQGRRLGRQWRQCGNLGRDRSMSRARASTPARPRAATGSWLLDPFNLTVNAAAATTIANDLALTNVTLMTTATSTSGPGTVSAGAGDIIVASAISAPLATNSLTLSAFHDVNIDASVTTGGAVTLQADNDGIEGGTVNYGLGGVVVAGGGLTAYSGTGSSEAPTSGTLLDSTSLDHDDHVQHLSDTTTSTDPLATPLVEVSDNSVAGTGTATHPRPRAASPRRRQGTGGTTATVTITPDTSTTSTEPTVETTPTETTVTAGETTATVGGTGETTSTTSSTTSTTTETTATAGGTTGTVTTGETSTGTTEPTVSTTPTETTVTGGGTTVTVGGGTPSTTPTTEPTVETTPTETTVTTGETTATVGGTESTTGSTEPPTVSTTPTETTVTGGGTTATVGGTTPSTTQRSRPLRPSRQSQPPQPKPR